MLYFFFFKQKTAYEMRISDWSSDVCSSDLERGAQAGTSHWTAILTVVMAPPSSADTLRKNPLGIYVDAIDWSRELDAASPTPAPASAAPAAPAVPANIPAGSPPDPNPAAPPLTPETKPCDRKTVVDG